MVAATWYVSLVVVVVCCVLVPATLDSAAGWNNATSVVAAVNALGLLPHAVFSGSVPEPLIRPVRMSRPLAVMTAAIRKLPHCAGWHVEYVHWPGSDGAATEVS